MIGLIGSMYNSERNTFLFWLGILTIAVGYWMFVGYDLSDKATADNSDFKTASPKLKHS